ncbi:hypothetical protein FS749_006997 [Ceratobasidium sp. UAMH 11750]|nr:hypothetical protein FS749_006997 [Ceratobasidium sp. UAMH 11750]
MPPPKRPRSDAGGHCDSTPTQAPLPNPASPPRTNHGHNGAKQTTNREQEPGRPFVERFPIPTAGAPISDKKMGRKLTKEDLHDYLASCGPLGDQEKFELAELSMTTGLTADGRTRWLNASLLVSQAIGQLMRTLTFGLVAQTEKNLEEQSGIAEGY